MGTAMSIREDIHQSSESPGLPWKLTSIRRTGRDKGLCHHGLLAKDQERAKAKQAMGIVPGQIMPWPRLYLHVLSGEPWVHTRPPTGTHPRACIRAAVQVPSVSTCTQAHMVRNRAHWVCVGNKDTSRQLAQCQMGFIQK